MSANLRVSIDGKRRWYIGADAIFTSDDNVDQRSIIIPANQIDGMTDEEIGKVVRELIPHATSLVYIQRADSYYCNFSDKSRIPADVYSASREGYEFLGWYGDKYGWDEYIKGARAIFHSLFQKPTIEDYIPREKTETEKARYKIARNRPSILGKLAGRDGMHCRVCGSVGDLTIDHITPLSRGGTNDIDNLQILCRSCNSRKGNSIPGEVRQ